MTTPTTEAGKRPTTPTPLEWLRDIAANGYIMSVHLRDGGVGDLMPADITAGIDEAVNAALDRVAAAVEAAQCGWENEHLAAINDARPKP